LPGVTERAAWGDYDNDGRLDILVPSSITRLWRNTGGGFIDATASAFENPPTATYRSSATWVDYNNDGRMDFVLTGTDYFQVWRNIGNRFLRATDISMGLPDFNEVEWGDFDNDGLLDFVRAGGDLFVPGIDVMRNNGNGFSSMGSAGLTPIVEGDAAWGDYNNDGRQDLLLSKDNSSSGTEAVLVFRNTGNGFTNANLPELPLMKGPVAWGDYDNDGRLDFVFAGYQYSSNRTQLWKNQLAVTNSPPTAPAGLSVMATGTVATLTWNPAADWQTPSGGLSYNVRMGTSPGASDVLAPSASMTGKRRLSQMGNAQAGLTATFNYTVGQAYYWSVQAVDNAFAGSPFAAEANFKILSPVASVVQAGATNQPSGDTNGDGLVSETELNSVLAEYFANSPWLRITNPAGLGGTNVTFSLTNSFAGAFSVEYSTNLVDWFLLGPATPRYLFIDSNVPAVPQRFYRLRWP
jgi:hypothetical protein